MSLLLLFLSGEASTFTIIGRLQHLGERAVCSAPETRAVFTDPKPRVEFSDPDED